MKTKPLAAVRGKTIALLLAAIALVTTHALAQTNSVNTNNVAWGSINNFDCVNETGEDCHGFEIDLEDCHSTDISYTYDYNHYGTPKIFEDTNSILGHTIVVIRYAAVWTNTGWSAYTAVPTGAIAPTQGHQFTDPTVNFGGEHFGVGFAVQPSNITYNWLVDDGTGTGNLTFGGQVYVSTPSFTLVGGAAVKAAIPPPAPRPFVQEYGDATWVKEIKTTTHNTNHISLRDLVTPDPDHPNAKNWQNSEPAEVEVEWTLMQPGLTGTNAQLAAAAENLTNRQEVVTRRWEFYAYAAGYDPESHEALTDNVGVDGIHGTGSYSNTVVVGDFLGAQMSAANELSLLGLIDHLQDGEVGTPYPTRSLVISAAPNFSVSSSGSLPDGLIFNPTNGQVSGTPTTPGIFIFNVSVWATNHAVVTKSYPVWIADVGEVLPPHCAVDVSVSGTNTGAASGTGIYTNGTTATVVATPATGYKLANWTENGDLVSLSPSYTFTPVVNQTLVANFVIKSATDCSILVSASPSIGGIVNGAGVFTNGSSVTVTAVTNAGFAFSSWVDSGSGATVSSNLNYTFIAKTNLALVAAFVSSSPPLAFGGNFYQLSGQPLAINIADLTTFDYSPDGYAIEFTGISPTTVNGLPLATNATQILVPANSAADSFSYTISDGYGGSAVGAGYIQIITNVTSQATALDVQSLPGYAGASFYGVPWYNYTAYRGTNASFTGTVRSWPVQAWADGSIYLWDDFSDLGGKPAQSFYRLSFP